MSSPRCGDILFFESSSMPRHPLAGSLVLVVAALAVTPLLSLHSLAGQGDGEAWRHFVAYVLESALINTVALLAGVAAITLVAGVGTAWLVTAYEFPGR